MAHGQRTARHRKPKRKNREGKPKNDTYPSQKKHRLDPLLSRHHRKPKSKGGGNEPENIAIVTKKEHDAYNVLFGNSNPPQIARILNKWIDPEWYFEARRFDPSEKQRDRQTSAKRRKRIGTRQRAEESSE